MQTYSETYGGALRAGNNLSARAAIAAGRVQRSYWQRIGGMPLVAPQAALPARAAIAIIGGGFAGLATALRIKQMQPDAGVVLIEAKSVGYGASGRNGGLMSPLPAPVWLATALNDSLHARAMGLLNAEVAKAAAWAKLIAPGAEVTAQTLALEAKGAITDAAISHISRILAKAGIDHEMRAEAAFAKPRSLLLAAHTINPYALVQGLAARARQLGVEIVEGSPVADISRMEEGARITLRDGRSISAATVVIATNAYTPSLGLPEAPSAKVVHNYMLATEPLDRLTLVRLTRAGQTSGQFVVELNKAYVFYRLHQGRLVFGGIEKLRHTEGGDLDVPRAVMAGLKSHLAATLDGAAMPRIAEAWGGRFHMTATDLPVIRRSRQHPAIVWNLGYGGTGVALSLALAPIAAALALGRKVDEPALSELDDAICSTRVPVAGALRFAAGVAGELVSGAMTRLAGNVALAQ